MIVMRSARSPLLKEAGDLSSALTDAEGRLIAQGRDIPMHMGVMGFTVKELLERIPAERMRDGDVWLLNLPEVGGNHLPDVKAVRPVFFEGRLVAFAVNLAHWADIGGAVPGSYVPWATESYQEGLRIAPVRIFTAAGPERETIDLILSNLRGREEREGDLLAQYAADDVAARRLAELFERYGAETIAACFERLHAESEAAMRAALRALPDGVWEGEDWLDDDGVDDRPIRIHVRIDNRAAIEATFDFSGTDPPGPRARQHHVLHRVLVGVLRDEGAGRARRAAQRGLLPAARGHRAAAAACSNCDPDRPVVGGNHETSQRVVDAIMKALAPVLPDRVAAGGPATAGLLIFGARRPDGRWGVLLRGARGRRGGDARRKDGVAAVRVHMSNVMNTPVEVIEGEYPVRGRGAGPAARLGRRRRAPRRPRLSPRVPRDRRTRSR